MKKFHESFDILFNNTRTQILEFTIFTEMNDLTLFNFIFLVDFFKESILPQIVNIKALETPDHKCGVMRVLRRSEEEIAFDIEKIFVNIETNEINKLKYLNQNEIEKLFLEESNDIIINIIIGMISKELIEYIDKKVLDSLLLANDSNLRKDTFDLKTPEGYKWGQKMWLENIVPVIYRMKSQTFIDSCITDSKRIIVPKKLAELLNYGKSFGGLIGTNLIEDKILILSHEHEIPKDTATYFMYNFITPTLFGDNYRFIERSNLKIFKPETIAEISLKNINEIYNNVTK